MKKKKFVVSKEDRMSKHASTMNNEKDDSNDFMKTEKAYRQAVHCKCDDCKIEDYIFFVF